jgi:predicted HAD superfamily Cof-like phosphohydrolase
MAMIKRNITREMKVQEFHNAFDVDIDSQPRESLLSLRKKLILEEAHEVAESLEVMEMQLIRGKPISKEQTTNLLKELCDLQYVLSGTIVSLNILKTRNFDAAFNLVHKSNMSKLDSEGNVVYDSNGKVLKGENYKAPDLNQLI